MGSCPLLTSPAGGWILDSRINKAILKCAAIAAKNKLKSNFECAAIAAGINLKADLNRTNKPSAQDKQPSARQEPPSAQDKLSKNKNF